MRKWKKQVAACLSSVMLLTAFSMTSMAAGGVTPTKTSNQNTQDYSRWSKPINSYLMDNGDDTLTRVEVSGNSIIVEKYDQKGVLQEAKTIEYELSKFGGFYAGEDYNFFVFGQSNPNEDDSREVIRVVKYSKDWKRLGEASLEGANTTEPFDAGSLRMAEYGGMLYIRTCHEMYTSDDGLNHQSNLTLSVRISDMEITDQFSKVMNTASGYVSHSFNQFIATDENLVAADHGDAYPRAVVLIKYVAKAGDETFTDKTERVDLENGYYTTKMCDYIEVLPIQGTKGANDTGVSLGGFVISDSSYLTAGNSVAQDSSYNANGVRNIFVTSTPSGDFSAEATKVNWITDYTNKSTDVSTPHLVKTSDGRILLLYTASDKVNYVYLDDEGNKDGTVQTMDGALSDCVPLALNDGSVIWYYTKNSVPTFCKIDADGKSSTFSASGSEEKEISLNVTSKELKVGDTFQLTASDGSDTALKATWTSSDNAVATVDSNGLVKAVKEGKATITAAVDGVNASCVITVTKKEIVLNSSAREMKVGDAFELTVSDGSATAPKATWTSSDETVAKVDGSGKVTAVKEGKATITAKVDDLTAECVITVTENPKNITLDKNSHEMKVGDTFQLTASDGSATAPKAVWTSSDKTIATVDDNGKVTAVKEGKVTITAKLGNSSAVCEITVTKTPKNITLNKNSHEMKVGDTFQLTVSDGSETAPKAAWTSSDKAVATVDDSGLVKAVKAGKVTITAKVDDAAAACTITISEPEKPKEISLNFTSYDMDTTETLELKAVTSGFDSAPEITWTSSDSKIATVDKNGKVKPVKEGSVTITAKAGNVKAECIVKISVPDENPDEIKLNYSEYELKVGKTVQLKVVKKATSSDAIPKTEWSSTDSSIAEVDDEGVVTAVKAGSVKIKATIGDSTVSCRIIVKEKLENEPDSISLNYSSREVRVGNTVQLKAKAKIGTSTVDMDADEVEWSSSDTSVATVDENGLVKAVKRGTATITAKVDDLTATCKITVTSSSGSSSGSSSSGSKRSKTDSTQNAVNKGSSSRPSYVVQGAWNQNADGSWNFTDSTGKAYKNSWGAVVNPYANTAAGQTDFDWFFFDENGKMRTGWFVDTDGNTYYLNENSDGTRGRMMTGWCWIVDAMGVQRCYYLNPISDGTKGKLLVNTVIDGYTINEKGEWTVNGVVQTK